MFLGVFCCEVKNRENDLQCYAYIVGENTMYHERSAFGL